MNRATRWYQMLHQQRATEWLFIFILWMGFGLPLSSCATNTKKESNTVRVMFYNVENLFDTHDDPQTDDQEFLPKGDLKWDDQRYHQKLKRIAWVISNIAEWEFPGIVGLAEIENEKVIQDLVRQSSLSQVDYQYEVSKGADPRGIDVALLWDSKRYKLVYANEIPHYGKPLNYKLGKDPRTDRQKDGKGRNSLWITLKELNSGKMLDVFVVHAPSRRGGVRSTSVKRSEVARKLRMIISNIQKKHPQSRILVMGDFNDNPSSEPILASLKAEKIPHEATTFEPSTLYNLAYPIERDGDGTHSFEGRMWTPDQIIVSGNLLYDIPHKEAMIFDHPELWNSSKKSMNRTYNGPFYNGGYSDHLPIYIDIIE